MEKDVFKIEDAKTEDVKRMRSIVRDAWVELYPNEKYGITAEDLSAIDWFKPEDMEKVRKEILEDTGTMHAWVLKNNKNNVVGFCRAEKSGDFGEVDAMYVIPELKGKGLGKELMLKALEWLDPKLNIKLKVVSYNKNAIEFYKKFGFKETTNKVIYDGTNLPSGKEIPRIEMVRQARQV